MELWNKYDDVKSDVHGYSILPASSVMMVTASVYGPSPTVTAVM